MTRPLVVKVTCGPEDPERCNQAFTVAAAAVASGAEVSLWLTGEAAWFGVPGRAEAFTLPLATPLPDLLAAVVAAGTVTVCSQCAARREITPEQLVEGVAIRGAASFAEEVLQPEVQALVY
ncbi:DsrE family protein [Nocardioides marmotae]|uniref:Sulfur reduction protein DsrE n=1 Tax=Nocardioides marmotae TaxID=2663857 RepID=A0A6I3JCF4_9ACTN|nr:DsrE family protein [Nocardioides marmotae]MCR6032162.1 sulfur reduction protein DsrE [Gordonia jinghuaiqii]MBC9735622.1 DsrE family protein [Nocardioides marmotae]MTB86718.1 sulfur reduction protein DsrE [Nocardioides marmotae]MTB95808.1 sulfur reduction protein DsrE [Nocardioides marmotae]QKE02839.1 sulfur reduction protein DsrE [Nocardioides marmotae]